MRRSDMIVEICMLLEDQSREGTAYLFKAEQLMQLLERAGMQPPLAETEEVIDGEEYVSFRYAWEPED